MDNQPLNQTGKYFFPDNQSFDRHCYPCLYVCDMYVCSSFMFRLFYNQIGSNMKK